MNIGKEYNKHVVLSTWRLGWEANSPWLSLLMFLIMKQVSDTRERDGVDSPSSIESCLGPNSTGRNEELLSWTPHGGPVHKTSLSEEHSNLKEGNRLPMNQNELDEEASRRIVAGFSEISSRIDAERSKIKRGEKPKKTKEILALKREIEMDEHLIEVEDLTARWNTDIDKGLRSEESKIRLLLKGPNVLTPIQQTPRTLLFLKIMFGGFG
jgi:hypothetical protein